MRESGSITNERIKDDPNLQIKAMSKQVALLDYMSFAHSNQTTTTHKHAPGSMFQYRFWGFSCRFSVTVS